MKKSRNPFRLRASENIESDVTFIRFFGPDVLDALPTTGPWEGLHVIRSAEGGGKTSLLRLMTPTALHALYSLSERDDCKDLHRKMVELGALSDDGPQILGVTISFGRNYASLEDLGVDTTRRTRLFFSLLNARIVLATLRSVMLLRKLRYPVDLDQLAIEVSDLRERPSNLPNKASGTELFQWALKLEKDICDAIDSFGPAASSGISGNEDLNSLFLIDADTLRIDGEPIVTNVLLMLDDVQKLTRRQREILLQELIESRSSLGIWVAERNEALDTEELLSSGSKEGREHSHVILLEDYWRKNHHKFKKFAADIADRRARDAADVDLSDFGSHLQSVLDGPEWRDKYSAAVHVVSERVRYLVGDHATEKPHEKSLFDLWLEDAEKFSGKPRDRAVRWRALEILIRREQRRNQPSLFDDPMPLNELHRAIPLEELKKKSDSPVRAAAQLFLSNEFGFPYYFSHQVLSNLASSNVEQFLGLAGDMFEEIASSVIRRRNSVLSAERQEQLLRRAADKLWVDIPKRVHGGNELRSFMDAIGKFSNWMTYQPTAPNDYGVNGIAISMHDRDVLMGNISLTAANKYKPLARLISNAIAHNLLEPQLDYNVKNGKWFVLNLNRLLCVRFRLPLQRGNFKEKTLDELMDWLKRGFRLKKVGDLI